MAWAPPRGTRDFYPEQLRIHNKLFSSWRESALRYGFEEYNSSILEQEEVYILKSGQEIVGQLFNFIDKGGRRVSLRPEMTPTFARMVAAKGSSLAKPLKWFSIVQCFRYERMSRGRKREHYQWNLDIVGVSDVTAEVELLAVATDLLEQWGLNSDDVVIRISHRGLLGEVLKGLAVPEEKKTDVFGIIDKRGKEPDEALCDQLAKQGMSTSLVQDLFAMLDEKSFDVFHRFFSEKGLKVEPLEELKKMFYYLELYGIQNYCEFGPSIVRGLPYYTGSVFECFDREGKFRAVFGGGRYDNLLDLFGAGKQPAAGLGFGDVVIMEILSDKGMISQIPQPLDFFLIPYSDSERPKAVQTVQALRKQGFASDLLLGSKKLKGALREAARLGPERVVLFLPDEVEQGLIVLRDLNSGQEMRVTEKNFLANPGSFLHP